MDYRKLHLLMQYGRAYSHGRIREKGFTDTEHMICSFIYVNESCSQEDIAQGIRMDKTTVAKALDSLTRKGFILRRQSSTDRRKNVLLLTEAGKESISGILSINDEWVSGVLSVLSPEERDTLEGYLERVLRAAKEINREREETEHA